MKKCWKISSFGAACAVALLVAAGTMASAQGGYKVVNTWKIGGDGWWDYLAVDPATSQLYITRGTHVMVVDTTSGKVIADITGFKGTHGVVFSTDGKTGFISDGGSNQVAVFNRSSHEVTAKVDTGVNPDGMVFDPYSKTVWAFNGRGMSATVIDSTTNKVVATIPLPGKPEFPSADGKGSVFVNIEDKNEVVHLDAKSFKAVNTWSIAPCESPSGSAIDAKHDLFFSVCDGGVMTALDTKTGKVVTTAKIGDGPDAAYFDSASGNVFSSNGQSGNLTVVHEDSPTKLTVLGSVATQASGRTMTFNAKSGQAYVVAATFGPRPTPTADNPRPRPTMEPGSFAVIVVGK